MNRTFARGAQFFPTQSAPPASRIPKVLPKPPNSLWFTARPSLNYTLTSLTSSYNLSKSHLFQAGLIPSISANLQGIESEFGTQLPHPRIRRWRGIKEMGTYLRNGTDLKSSQYKRLTSLLGNLEGLLPYAELVDKIGTSTHKLPNLVNDPVSLANAGMGGQKDGGSGGSGGGLKDQLVELLENFQTPATFSAEGIKLERAVGQARRLGKFDESGRVMAIGKRKESGARVWLVPTIPSTESTDTIPGRILVNNQPLPSYFALPTQRASVVLPLSLTQSLGSFNIFAIAKGGGLNAQSEAIGMGIARALAEWERLEIASGKGEDSIWREILKKNKLLERDPRMVERKKTGQLKARKMRAWVKR